MKRATLIAIILFSLTVGGIYLYTFLTYINSTTTKPLAQQRQPVTPNVTEVPSTQVTQTQSIVLNNLDLANFKKSLKTSTGTSTMSMSDVYSHASLSDCYLVINNKVYDVTKYIPYHPAGSRIISQYCGTEVTGIFASIHSNRAWDLLSRYKIGTISKSKQSIMPKILSYIGQQIEKQNKGASVIKVSPKNNLYVAKVIFNHKLYEIHINTTGQIIKEELADNENWNSWEVDKDDNK